MTDLIKKNDKFVRVEAMDLISAKMKAFKKEKSNISSKVVRPMTLKELNKRIDQSLLDSENGKLAENNDLTTEIREWI